MNSMMGIRIRIRLETRLPEVSLEVEVLCPASNNTLTAMVVTDHNKLRFFFTEILI